MGARILVIAGLVLLGLGCAAAPRTAPAVMVAQPSAPTAIPEPQSPWDQRREAAAILARMTSIQAVARRLLEQTRAQRDVVKTLCVNDKLAQLDVALRSARDRKKQIDLGSDGENGARELTILRVVKQRAEQLQAETNQCLGQEASFAGQTQVLAARVSEEMVTTTTAGSYDEAREAPAPAAPPTSAPVRPAPVQYQNPSPDPAAAQGGGGPPAPSNQPFFREAPHDAAMLVYTATLTVEVHNVGASLKTVEALARETGGYLASRSDTQITIRVPRARFLDVIGRIERLGDVVHRDITAEDVTDEYVDLEIRLKNLRALRDRLEQLLKDAKIEQALAIQRELGRILADIESMEGRLRLLRDKIAYSTITVALQPVAAQSVQRAQLPFPWLSELGLSALLRVGP